MSKARESSCDGPSSLACLSPQDPHCIEALYGVRSMTLPHEIWCEILRLRLFAMHVDIVMTAATCDFQNPAVVSKVQTAWRAIGSPHLYASAVTDMLVRHTAWHTYYA